jgi:hypothetical protein
VGAQGKKRERKPAKIETTKKQKMTASNAKMQ